MAIKAPPKNRINTNGAPNPERIPSPASLVTFDDLHVRVVGITPLMCASPASMQPDTDGPARGKKKEEDKRPEVVARKAAYFDADGDCCYPNVTLFSALLTAADLMKLKVGEGRYPQSAVNILRAGLTFNWERTLVKLLDPKSGRPLREADYEIDMRRAVNQNTGGAIVAIRPLFRVWSAVFELKIDTGNSDLTRVIADYFDDILRFTGMSIGLGAFRAYVKPKGKTAKANAGGPYGKFVGNIVS